MREQLVSVIVPAHNAAAHIREAVTSALHQTYRQLEVIVVDDGSTDETATIVHAIATQDPRVSLITQRNAGVATARNRGIEASSGAFVAPLDADDYWLPDKITAQVERMRQGGSGMGLVYTWWYLVDEDGRIVDRPAVEHTVEGWLFDALVSTNFIGNASLPLIRRRWLDHVGGYDSSLRARGGQGCEDWDLNLRIAAAARIGVVARRLSVYRRVDGSMSSDIRQMAQSYELVLARLRQDHPRLPGRLVRWSRANFYRYLAGASSTTADHAQTLRIAWRAVLADPLSLLSPGLVMIMMQALLRRAEGLDRPGPRQRSRPTVAPTGPRRPPWMHGLPYGHLCARRWRQVTSRPSPPRHHHRLTGATADPSLP